MSFKAAFHYVLTSILVPGFYQGQFCSGSEGRGRTLFEDTEQIRRKNLLVLKRSRNTSIKLDVVFVTRKLGSTLLLPNPTHLLITRPGLSAHLRDLFRHRRNDFRI